MRKHNKALLSILLILTIVFGFVVIPSNEVLAASYNVTANGKNYGTYQLYTDANGYAAYIRDQMMARNTSIIFYYADIDRHVSGVPDNVMNDIKKAFVHCGIPNAGDYLANTYHMYGMNYTRFYGYYKTGSGSYDLYQIRITVDYLDTAAQEKYIDSQIHSILNGLKLSGKSDYEKTLAIYSWITRNIVYDYLAVDSPDQRLGAFTPYQALTSHKAVCQGIATLFYRMLLEEGIDNRISFNDNHCWNIVKINGKYYYADATWDLGYSPDDFSYFLLGGGSYFEMQHKIYSYNKAERNYSIPINSSNFGSNANAAPNDKIKNFVKNLYVEILQRNPSTSEILYWSQFLVVGKKDGASMAREFFNSNEFVSRKVTNEKYIQILYKVFLDRTPENGSSNFWLQQLYAGKSRKYVLEGFIGSAEWKTKCANAGIYQGTKVNVTGADAVATPTPKPTATPTPAPTVKPSAKVYNFVTRIYSTVLNRTPDKTGLESWALKLANKKMTATEVVRSFTTSKEYTSKNVSNDKYIEDLYRVFLDRKPDSTGKAYWIGRLKSGKTRDQILTEFAKSSEFAAICRTYGVTP